MLCIQVSCACVLLLVLLDNVQSRKRIPFGEHFGIDKMKPVKVYYEPPSPEVFYREHLKGNKPAVVKGFAFGWPAMEKWKNMSYLIEKSTETYQVLMQKIYKYDERHSTIIDMTMKEFIERLQRNENVYMDNMLPNGLAQDVIWPRFLACDWWLKQMTGVQIFFNRGQSNTDSHVDNTETMFTQILGRRQWILNPPTDNRKLYSGDEFWEQHMTKSRINPDDVDVAANPESMKADYHIAIAEPGDLVYCPESWFHQVKTMDSPNIALTIFHKVLRCDHWVRKKKTDYAYLGMCEQLRKRLPKEITCSEPPEADMLPLNLLARKHPNTPGLMEVCKSDDCSPVENKKYGHSPCTDAARKHHKVIKSVSGTKLNVPSLGLSLYGTHKDVLSSPPLVEDIVKGGYTSCARGVVLSDEDGSLDAFVQAVKSLELNPRIFRPVVLVSLKLLLSQTQDAAGAAALLRQMTTDSKTRLGGVAVLMLQAEYCEEAGTGNNSTSSCQRKTSGQEWNKWMAVWKEARKMWKENIIYSLGVRDWSAPEFEKLVEQEDRAKGQALQVVHTRIDPFYRNVQIRDLAERHNIHIMAHGILGKFYPEPNPLTTSHAMLSYAFAGHTAVYAAAAHWGLRKKFMVMPRSRSGLHLRITLTAWRVSEETSVDGYAHNIDVLVPEHESSAPHTPEPADTQEPEQEQEQVLELPNEAIFLPFTDEVIKELRKGKGLPILADHEDPDVDTEHKKDEL